MAASVIINNHYQITALIARSASHELGFKYRDFAGTLPAMNETALVAFATFFATIGPIEAAALFAALTARSTARERRIMAFKGVGIATVILLLFSFFGGAALERLGITLDAMRVAGGILLFLIAVDMVFARPSGSTSTTEDETDEAKRRQDISVFPLATPLIAGPGTMGAVVMLSAEAGNDMVKLGSVIAALMAVLAICLASLMVSSQLQRIFGVTGLNVLSRVVGVLLAALAVQFVFDGLKSSFLA